MTQKAMLHHLGSSVSFGRLSLPAKVLWTMLLTAADDQGRGSADPDVVKWQVCPNVPELTPDTIPAALQEMVRQEMLHLYSDGRRQLYQVVRWWDYQQLQWARPSQFEPPAGWTDRVRAQRGRRHVTLNWDTPGGFLDGPPPQPAEPAGNPPGDPAGQPPGNPPGRPPGGPPGATDQLQSRQLNPAQPRATQPGQASPGGDARAGPVTAPTAPGTGPKKRPKPSPPAVLAFRRAAHRYPPKSWYADVDQAVGRQETDLQFWHDVVKAWVGLGWNPTNVSGMLDCFKRRQLPGRDGIGNPRASPRPSPFEDYASWLQEQEEHHDPHS